MIYLIELEKISKIYRNGNIEVSALDDINLNITAGEFVAIVGRSGSGKSTLMNILGTLDTPTSGRYLLNGNDVSSFSDSQLCILRSKTIGFIFQGFNLIPNMSALENVEMPLLYQGFNRNDRTKYAKEALSKVGLSNRLSHLPSQLSGGQQQRVAIARAIVSSPPIILADEPTGNLDTVSGEEVLKLLKTLNGYGHTLIMITHDMGIASEIPRVINILDGKITHTRSAQ